MNLPTAMIDGLAAYRLTRLVTADTITDRWRDRWIADAYHETPTYGRRGSEAEFAAPVVLGDGELIARPVFPGDWPDLVERDSSPPRLAELVTCRWCAGMWVGFGVIAARAFAPRFWDPVARALALSAAAALIARLETD